MERGRRASTEMLVVGNVEHCGARGLPEQIENHHALFIQRSWRETDSDIQIADVIPCSRWRLLNLAPKATTPTHPEDPVNSDSTLI